MPLGCPVQRTGSTNDRTKELGRVNLRTVFFEVILCG